MLEKLLNYKNKPWVKQLRDPRTLGLIAFALIAILVTWSGIKAVQHNYELEKQITHLEQQNKVQKLANQNMKLQNEYYSSDQYLELSARQNLGLAKPGEKELIVPKSVALSYTKDLSSKTDKTTSQSNKKQPFYMRNLKAWRDFFLGRKTKSEPKN